MNYLRKRHHSRGFSLIEVMFVLVLIGMIAAIVISAMQNTVKNKLASKTASEMELILNATTSFYMDTKKRPDTLYQLVTANYLTFPNRSDNQLINPWGYPFTLQSGTTQPAQLVIKTRAPNNQLALLVANELPNAVVDNVNITAAVPIGINNNFVISTYPIYWVLGGTGGTPYFSVKKIHCPSGSTNEILTKLAVPGTFSTTVNNTTVNPLAAELWGRGSQKIFFVIPSLTANMYTGNADATSENIWPVKGFTPVVKDIGSNYNILIKYKISVAQYKEDGLPIVVSDHAGDPYKHLPRKSNPAGDIKTTGAYEDEGYFLNQRFGPVYRAVASPYNRNRYLGTATACNLVTRPFQGSCSNGSWSRNKTMSAGYIGNLKVIQWCQLNNT